MPSRKTRQERERSVVPVGKESVALQGDVRGIGEGSVGLGVRRLGGVAPEEYTTQDEDTPALVRVGLD